MAVSKICGEYSPQARLELIYNKKKYGILCERRFEVNSNSIVIGFVSNGCF